MDALDEEIWHQETLHQWRRSSSDSKTQRRRSSSVMGIPTHHFQCLHYCCLEPH
ncbi:hypothetical protein L798_07373 [Zootermopsis nevadensis]|uniref:Uncharacterized protein n=1 Tax=Zootermopsis nevadensis TaxID=136037 RepID=A0A067RHA9_ZOONE|nr:hypothetical protein L798_07373 [Zootermopsis nevadensis]